MADLPLIFRASPLPDGFRGTPQQFLDALVARLAIETTDDLALFGSGAVLPASDNGPFLLDGTSWYVWDVVTGAYVPLILDPLSQRWGIFAVGSIPDNALYDFWIATDVNGKAQKIMFWDQDLDGTPPVPSWKDVYTDPLAVLTAAINEGDKKWPASAKLNLDQTIVNNGDFVKVLFNTVIINYDINPTAYIPASSHYLVPVDGIYAVGANLQVDNDLFYPSDPTLVELDLRIAVNAAYSASGVPTSGTAVASPPGSRWYPQVSGLISASANDVIAVYISATGGAAGNLTIAPQSQFFIHLVNRVV